MKAAHLWTLLALLTVLPEPAVAQLRERFLRSDTNTVFLADYQMVFRRISPRHYGTNAPDFFLLESEVTNQMYQRYLKDTGRSKDDLLVAESARRQKRVTTASPVYDMDNSNLWWFGNSPPAALTNHPVVLMKISEARQFCEWLGRRFPDLGIFRLPTVEEWMLAAYGKNRNYPWGEKWDVTIPCVSSSCEKKRPAPDAVKTHTNDKTPEGIYDLGGNVAEWVADPNGFRDEPRWMGSSFKTCPEKELPSFKPHNDWWGYVHNSESRMENIGFRVLLEPRMK